jgi:hypothetical protein
MNGNTLTALVAVLVFVMTFVALWYEQTWWFVVPFIGYVVLVPLVYALVGGNRSAPSSVTEGTPKAE